MATKSPPQCTAPRNGHYGNSKTALKCPFHAPAARKALAQGLDLDSSINLSPPRLSDYGIEERSIRKRGAKDPDIIKQALNHPQHSGGKSALAETTDNIDMLAELSRDGSDTIRTKVARNRHLPEDGMEDISTDPATNVRWVIAGRRDAPKHVLTTLASDPEDSVRHAALSNPETPREVLVAALRNSPSLDEREALSKNTALSADELRSLLGSRGKYVLRNLAENPAINSETQREIYERAIKTFGDGDSLMTSLATNKSLDPDLERDILRSAIGIRVTSENAQTWERDQNAVLRALCLREPPQLDTIEDVADYYQETSTGIRHWLIEPLMKSPLLPDHTIAEMSEYPQDYVDQASVPHLVDELRKARRGRIRKLIGDENATDEAVTYLDSEGWENLTPEDPEVFIAVTMLGRSET